jgi:malate dehydrogenase (oxaloacetate-decarboxylating)(NADP+)
MLSATVFKHALSLRKGTYHFAFRVSLPSSILHIKSFSKKVYHKPLNTKKHGIDILHDPLWNKSTAFDISERDRLGLRGLIPPIVRTLEDQVKRSMGHIRSQPNDVAKNLYLQELQNRNETLYYRLLVDYIEEIAPLVYTPTVGTVSLINLVY